MTRLFPTMRARLLLLVLLALVPVCALLVQLGAHYYRFVVSSAYQSAGALASLMAAEQQRQIDDMRQMLLALSKMPDVKARRDTYCSEFAEILEQRRSEIVSIGLVDARGRTECGVPAKIGLPEIFMQEWFQKALKAREFSVGTYQIEPRAGKSVAVAVLPIADDAGQLQGAVYAALDLAWITRVNALAGLPERSILLMFDQSGLVLQRNPDPQSWVGGRHPDSPFLREIMSRGASGVLEMPALDGIRRLVAFRTLPSQSGQIYLVVGIPSDVAFEQIDKEFAVTAVEIALGMLAALAIAWLAGDRLVTDRIRRLAKAASQFGDGVRDVRSGLPYRPDEIGQLARAFDNMVSSIEQREEQLQRYYLALDEHAIVSATDADGNIIHVNDKFCEISGYTREELMGQNHRILKTEFLSAEGARMMWETISQGKVWHSNVCNRNKAGGRFWVTSTITPFMDEQGRPTQYIAIRTDITETIAVKDALQRSEELYRLLAENSQDVVALHERSGRYLYVSPSCSRVLGYERDELIGTDPLALAHEKDRDHVKSNLFWPVLAGETQRSAVFRMKRKSGEHIWVEVTATPVFDEGGRVLRIQSSLRDITLRKEAEDKLRLRDRAIQASPSGIILFSAENRNPVVYANEAFASITGFEKSDIYGRSIWRLARQLMDAGNVDKIRAASADNSDVRVSIQFTRRDGILRWADCSMAPIRNEQGDATHFVAAISDVTGRVMMMEELVRAKEASEQANQAKSDFLARMTHELRTPLNSMLGFAQLLQIDPERLSPSQLDGIDRLIKSGWHLRELIDEVLDLSRIEAGALDIQPEHVELDAMLRECVDTVSLMAAERAIGIAIRPEIAEGGRVRADRKRLKQVLLNLLSNAVKFNRAGGEIAVKSASAENGRLRITVSDTGPGIEPRRMAELFQPFSRLDADRAEIPGTGIGLAISRRFIHLMGGEIGVDSMPGCGSAFWIELPCAEQESVQVQEAGIS